MLDYYVPGSFGQIKINNLVFDYNGTLALDGKLVKGIKKYLLKLSKKVKIYIITADTFGTAEKGLKKIPCTLIKAPPENQAQFKKDSIILIGSDNTIAFGNGRNDKLMLKEAKIGIFILQNEGASPETLLNADIACKNIIDALELLLNEKRLIATLRE